MKMKKVAAVVMAAVMSLSMATAVSAEQAEPQAEAGLVEMRLSLIHDTWYDLVLGSTTASIVVQGYGQNDCVSINMYYAMQYKEGGSWHTWYSSSKTFYPSGSYTDRGIAYPKGKAAWRLEVVAKATSSSGRTETVTDYKYV